MWWWYVVVGSGSQILSWLCGNLRVLVVADSRFLCSCFPAIVVKFYKKIFNTANHGKYGKCAFLCCSSSDLSASGLQSTNYCSALTTAVHYQLTTAVHYQLTTAVHYQLTTAVH
eukprot:Lankesteria_metandrocarpae@DN8497_c0_g1_i1.p1